MSKIYFCFNADDRQILVNDRLVFCVQCDTFPFTYPSSKIISPLKFLSPKMYDMTRQTLYTIQPSYSLLSTPGYARCGKLAGPGKKMRETTSNWRIFSLPFYEYWFLGSEILCNLAVRLSLCLFACNKVMMFNRGGSRKNSWGEGNIWVTSQAPLLSLNILIFSSI